MEIKEFVQILKNWGTKNDIINSKKCNEGCNDCELNEKIILGEEITDICTVISRVSKHLNA